MFAFLLLSLLHLAVATPFTVPLPALPKPAASERQCNDLIIPMTLSTTTFSLQFPRFESGYEATSFLLDMTKRSASTNMSSFLGGANSVIGKSYQISARYCIPGGSYVPRTLQILTHGIGFDKNYWHFGDNKTDYSFHANKAGFATLSYDRLGTGNSSPADPYNEQQGQLHLQILAKMTKMINDGELPSIPRPGKVVHVGHSYGALLANGMAASYPELTDGVVLTGYSHDTTWNRWFEISTGFHLAKDNQPDRLGAASTGYLTWGDRVASQYNFFAWPFFDTTVLDSVEGTKQPFAIGELFTQHLVTVPAPTFAKPVILVAAERDLIFCGSDCHGVVDGPNSKTTQIFPAAKPLKVHIQPNTGHAMNLHHNATAWFNLANRFLYDNGFVA